MILDGESILLEKFLNGRRVCLYEVTHLITLHRKELELFGRLPIEDNSWRKISGFRERNQSGL